MNPLRGGQPPRTLQVQVGDRTVDFTAAEAAKELGVSEEFVVQRTCPRADEHSLMLSCGSCGYRKTAWLMGINESPVYVVREDARRWAVWTKNVTPQLGGDRWGHFRTMRDAMQFARDVVNRRALFSEVAPLMVVDPAHGGSK